MEVRITEIISQQQLNIMPDKINEFDEEIDGVMHHIEEYDDGELLIAPIDNEDD